MTRMNIPELAARLSTRDTLVVAGLFQRTGVLLLSVLETGRLAGAYDGWVTLAASACCVYSVAVLLALLNGKRLLDKTPALILDVLLALAVNGIGVAFIPHGRYLTEGYDLFWQYMLGTVAVVTARLGTRSAAILVAIAAVGEIGLAAINGVDPSLSAAIQAADRVGWLAAAVAIPALVARYADVGQALASEAGRIEGSVRARKDVLHELHDTIAQWLGEIVRGSGDETLPEESRLQRAREAACAAVQAEKATLARRLSELQLSLSDGVRSLGQDFAARGLLVAADTDQLLAMPSGESSEALLAAMREALANVLRHARVNHARVHLFSTSTSTVAEVADQGCGFDLSSVPPGYGLHGSITDRLRALGGKVEITSAPGAGTRVVLRVPNMPMRETGKLDTFTSWFPVPALAYRVFLTPLQILLAVSVSGVKMSQPLWVAAAAIFTLDVVCFVLATMDRLLPVLKIKGAALADFGMLAAINIWQWSTLSRANLTGQANQVFWGYLFGAIILWTGVKGGRAGLRIVLLGTAMQIALLVITTAPLTAATASLVNAVGKLVVAWALTLIISKAARHAVEHGQAAGRSAGRLLATVADLEHVRSHAVATLREMAAANGPPDDAGALLGQLRGRAILELGDVRVALSQSGPQLRAISLFGELEQALRPVRLLGTRVELVNAALGDEPASDERDALVIAARSVVETLCRGIETPHIVVAVTSSDGFVQVVIRDHGTVASPADLARLQAAATSTVQVLATSHDREGTRIALRTSVGRGGIVEQAQGSAVLLDDVHREHERRDERKAEHDDQQDRAGSTSG